MASRFYTPPSTVIDGDIAYADDVNSINNESDSGFALVEGELDAFSADVQAQVDKAQMWAEEPEDSEVEPGKYSSLHWAAKAEDQQILATAAKTAAELAQSLAETAQTAAETAETNAETAYANSLVAQAAAEAAQAAAELAQTAAETAETNAETAETNAAASAAAALASEGNASTSETNAAASEAAALASQTAAELAQSLAETAQTAAEASEAAALASENAANLSAINASSSADDALNAKIAAEIAQAASEAAAASAVQTVSGDTYITVDDTDPNNISLSFDSSFLNRKNLLLNPVFSINQRTVSGTVSLAADEYGHDRWCGGASGCTYTFSTSGGVTTLTITAGTLVQKIEDVNVRAGDVVLSWTGSAQGRINAGSYGDSGEVKATLVGATQTTVEFGTGTLTSIQLEYGEVATELEYKSWHEELEACKRYFQKSYEQGVAPGTATQTGANRWMQTEGSNLLLWDFSVEFPVEMRSAPTIVVYSPSTGAIDNIRNSTSNADRTITATRGNTKGIADITTDQTMAQYSRLQTHWTADAEL